MVSLQRLFFACNITVDHSLSPVASQRAEAYGNAPRSKAMKGVGIMKSSGVKRVWLTILVVGAAAGLGWVIFGHFQDRGDLHSRSGSLRPVPVAVAQIQRGPIVLQRTFSGELEALTEFVVAPKVSGRVERVLVNIADRVNRGQVVAELEMTNMSRR